MYQLFTPGACCEVHQQQTALCGLPQQRIQQLRVQQQHSMLWSCLAASSTLDGTTTIHQQPWLNMAWLQQHPLTEENSSRYQRPVLQELLAKANV
jgi:hypothetical protein